MDEVQLNTLYIVTEGTYLHRDGQTVLVELEKKVLARIPLHMIDSIAVFGHIMVSPGLMEACAENHIALNFMSASGRLLARVDTPGGGGVVLRKSHYRRADDPKFKLELARVIVAGKVQNCRQNLLRSARDGEAGPNPDALRRAAGLLMYNVERAAVVQDMDQLRGIEGDAARLYFEHFALMTPDAPECLKFKKRSRRPPLDPINSLLSLFYSILTHDCVAALTAAGLDASVGFLHEDRPGRPSLALDLMEEFRPYVVDQVVLTAARSRALTDDHGRSEEGRPGVLLTKAGRAAVLDGYERRMLRMTRGALPDFGGTVRRHLYRQAQRLGSAIRDPSSAWTGLSWR